MKTRSFHALVLVVLLAGASACNKANTAPDNNPCDAGTTGLFCRTESGDAGTRTCGADGKPGECKAREGAGAGISTGPTGFEPDVPDGVTNFDPGGFGDEGGNAEPPPEDCVAEQPLYAVCGHDCECTTGACAAGYCTQPCDDLGICMEGGVDGAVGDCSKIPGVTSGWCAPECTTQGECDQWYGEYSSCVVQQSFYDATQTTAVCLDWWGFDEDAQTDIPIPLTKGSPCDADSDCSAGQLGTSLVCENKKCVAGCRGKEDCPSDFPFCQVGSDIDCGANDMSCFCTDGNGY